MNLILNKALITQDHAIRSFAPSSSVKRAFDDLLKAEETVRKALEAASTQGQLYHTSLTQVSNLLQ